MSSRKLQKEVEAVFKKIHEGLDLFNYYFSRHEASSNDSQREKLESDLKKEIKKLQKFRDQIKNWQGNDALEATIASSKLQEHRRLVEEAMECYKEVEKNSKMKSFSNQSIMLASMDNGDNMSPEVQEAYEYLAGVIDDLTAQNEQFEEEYDTLSQKKVRKSNMSAIEDRKQELEGFRLRNEFHIAKIESVMNFLKSRKIAVDSIWEIQEDLNFYVESNQEPDFIDDETLYDDLLKEARENSENNIDVGASLEDTVDLNVSGEFETTAENINDTAESSPPASKPKTSSSSPAPQQKPAKMDTPSKPIISLVTTPKDKNLHKTSNVEMLSPAIGTTLKPASTPSKPVGALKWSLAAAGASKTPEAASVQPAIEEQSTPVSTPNADRPKSAIAEPAEQENGNDSYQNETDASSELLSLLTQNEKYSPYFDVLKNSGLSAVEMELFTDMELLKVPPGLQSLAVGFTASNKLSTPGKLLKQARRYEPFTDLVRNSGTSNPKLERELHMKPPLFLSKLQNYWNRLRIENSFDQFLEELEHMEEQNSAETTIVRNELTMVIFYGYYLGYLPLEHIIAESLLHKNGWKPYELQVEGQAGAEAKISGKSQFWLKPVGETASSTEAGVQYQTGDFRVFDCASWDIQIKYGFKFDHSLSRQAPVSSLL